MRVRSNNLPCLLYIIQFVNGYNDQHVFNLKTSNNKCLTVTGDRFTIKTDVECSSWEQQQFVYSSISNQIISAGGDSSLCLSFSESEISSKLCDTDDLSQVFTSPVSLTNSELSFVTTSGVTNQLTPVSSSSSYPVLKTECVLPEYSTEARHSTVSNTNATPLQKGYNTNDQIIWSCESGFQTATGQQSQISKCSSDGTWTLGNNALACIRTSCPFPSINVKNNHNQPDVFYRDVNILQQITVKEYNSVKIDNGENKFLPVADDWTFQFDDEIYYKCKNSYVNEATGDDNPVSSICSSNGEWSVPPIVCRGNCQKGIVNVPDNSSACGIWETPNFPNRYPNDVSCKQRFSGSTTFKIKIMAMELEYQSRYEVDCLVHELASSDSYDTLGFISYEDDTFEKEESENSPFKTENDNSDKRMTSAICGYSNSDNSLREYLVPNESGEGYRPKVLETLTANFEIIFRTDIEVAKNGSSIMWWTSDIDPVINETYFQQNKCFHTESVLEKITKMQEDSKFSFSYDYLYGKMDDYYHFIYEVIIIVLIVYVLVKLFNRIAYCLVKHKRERGKSEEEESEHGSGHRRPGRMSISQRVTLMSEKGIEGLFGDDTESSDDESSDSDDDIDFSLCTLLDMKSNSEQLQEVLDKLNLEAETFEGY